MRKHRVGVLVVGLLTIGAASAAAQTANPSVVDLGKGKVTGPFSFEVSGPSDMVVHKVVYDAAGTGNTWHSHPGNVNVVVKAGSITRHVSGASGCTSATYSAGQAYTEPAGVVHLHEGTPDLEAAVTYIGVPVGQAPSKDEAAPTGANCPAKLNTGITRTELSRATIQGTAKAAATGDSEMLMQFVTVPAKTNFRDSWYSSPAALFGSMKSGSLTVFTGDATSCTSQTYTAGQALFVPAGQVIFVRNDGSTPAEVYATRLALPVGAAPRVDTTNPGGANCPDAAAAPTGQLPTTGGSAGALVMLGLWLTGVGTAARVFGQRR